MNAEILLIRDNDGYRMLHGYLRLASLLSTANEAEVEASGEGRVKVVRTAEGILIEEGHRRVPLLGDRKWIAPAS